MATGTRVRKDFVEGVLDAALTSTDTNMSSSELADLPVIDNAGTGDYAALVISNEIVHVITHTSAATTATIERGQEGTTAAAHDTGASWHHGPTEDDFTELAGSGASSEVLYDSTVSGGAVALIDITSISQAYDKLEVEIRARSDRAGTTADSLEVRLNNDSTDANYDHQHLRGNAGTASATEHISTTGARLCGQVVPAGYSAGLFSTHKLWIPDYTSTSKTKEVHYQSRLPGDATGQLYVQDGISHWENTAAVSRLGFEILAGNNLDNGTRVIVRGWSV